MFESLESRRHFTATLNAGVLTIVGTAGADDYYVSDFNSSIVVTNMNTQVDEGPFAGVASIEIDMQGGNDQILVDNGVTVSASINGGTGADTLYGGSGDDTLDGGTGSDYMDGRVGFDTVTYASRSAPITIPTTAAAGGAGEAGEDDAITGSNDLVVGGSGNDVMRGSPTGSRFEGGAGNDFMSGNSQNDYFSGNDGNDSLYGALGNDTIDGGTGDDLIDGGSNNDSLTGGDDDDSVYGGSGTDFVFGGNGNDFVDGQSGNGDFVSGEAGDDSLQGDSGSGDVLDGGTGIDRAFYDARGASVAITVGDNIFNDGEAGENDNVVAVDGVVGGTGDDFLSHEGLSSGVSLVGAGGNDTLIGGLDNDSLDGSDGNDYLDGGTGADTLDGGNGTDTVTYGGRTAAVRVTLGYTNNLNGEGNGAEGDQIDGAVERAIGGSGNDLLDANTAAFSVTLTGNAGNDTLTGGQGDDDLDGGLGTDSLEGGSGGIDTADYRNRTENLRIAIGYSNNGATGENDVIALDISVLQGGSGNDVLWADLSAHGVTLYGNGGDDQVYGSALSDRLVGGVGDDYMMGRGGDDTLATGQGKDSVSGAGGNDTLDFQAARKAFYIDLRGIDYLSGDHGGANTTSIRNDDHNIDNVQGTKFNDVIVGSDYSNKLFGGSGNDTIYGNRREDTLWGGPGDDFLDGGRETDSLDGGSGRDVVDNIAGDVVTSVP